MRRESNQEDIFDRIMRVPILRNFEPFYKKHKEILLYLFFGGLTFAVSISTYWIFTVLLEIDELVANVFSWIISVTFAFFTNCLWVFQTYAKTALELVRQMVAFFGGRVATLAVEEAILGIFIVQLGFNSMVVKLSAQAIVIILNYVISKILVFRKKIRSR